MKRITRKEEEAMQILWKARKGFIRELIDLHPDPKPLYTTFSTVIRGLEEKGYVGHKAYGKNHEYFPLIKKEEYRKIFMKDVVNDYFGSSYKNVVSFFVNEKKLSSDDLKKLIQIIEKGGKMDNLLLYLLRVSAGTALLYLAYLLFFSRDTFYLRNRVLLILTLILPTILPAIKIPVISQDALPVVTVNTIDNLIFPENALENAMPVASGSFDYNRLFLWIYFTIAVLVLLRGVISVISTLRIIKKGTVKASRFPKIIISDMQLPPFSFFPYAVIPAEVYKNGNYKDILDHEFAHIRQGHTFDLLLGEIFIALQWFNPFVWLIKRSIVLNHEYLADQVSLCDKNVKEYQYRLLSFKVRLKNISLAHNFNSLIKNRIIMINKKPTRKYARIKNLVILPVVALVAYAFATPVYSYTQPGKKSPENIVSSILVDGTVKGIILDQNGSPLPGTNIQVSGTTIGTSADLKGQFTLVNVTDKSSLLFSFVGYKVVKVSADFNKEMIVRMERITLGIESVVIAPGKKTIALDTEKAKVNDAENSQKGVKTVIPEPASKENVYIISEEMPTFQGGSAALAKWISDRIGYPEEAVRKKISGVVGISFVVNSTGEIGTVKVNKSLDPLLDAEAKKVISSLPNWDPGKQNGTPVDVDFAIPIIFALPAEEPVFSKTSVSAMYKHIYSNIVYPQQARESSDTGKIYVVVTMNKGGVIKECKAFTEAKDIKVPILNEIVITSYKAAGQTKINSSKETGSEQPFLKNECLRIAKKLTEIDIPEWKDKDMEFALSFNFVLK